MERDAVCVLGPGLGVGEQDLFRHDGMSVDWENCGVLNGELLPRSWLGVSFKVEILRESRV